MLNPRATRSGWPTGVRGEPTAGPRARRLPGLYASGRGSPMGCSKTAAGAVWVPLVVGLAAAVLGAGCHDERTLVGTQGRLRLSVEQVAFPGTYVGVTREQTVRVLNAGRSSLLISWAPVDAPFTVEGLPV